MDKTGPLRLVVSIDVEEEGLFGGSYARSRPGVRNVEHLTRLLPLTRDAGIPLTLFCAHSVFSDLAACRAIAHLRDAFGAEVGAHLHHWNTPPVAEAPPGAGVSTALVPLEEMAAKLESLFALGAAFQGAALTSFRMGRWDLRQAHWPLLAELGVLADASVRPLHCGLRPTDGPNHFAAPREPYRVAVGAHEIFEFPLTTTPLWAALPHWPGAVAALGTKTGLGSLQRAGQTLGASLQKWGGLTLLPAYQPLWMLQCCTRAHVAAGGRNLSLTWHSSEMMPGGAPHMPDAQAVDTFMNNMTRYVQWLRRTWPVEALTLRTLCALERANTALQSSVPAAGVDTGADADWLPATPCVYLRKNNA